MDVKKIRKDFPFIRKNKNIIFFDNSSTTLKPKNVIDAVSNYYTKLSANTHRGDYRESYLVDEAIRKTREIVADFINANPDEIIFTNNTTSALNMIAYSYVYNNLNEGDEILISEVEHASNILPWYRIAKLKKAIVKFIPLDKGVITIPNFKKALTSKTKFVSLAQTGNVLGDTIDVKKICALAHAHGAKCIIDGAQSAPHHLIDVKDMDCDFFAFSGHKLGAPTGVGILYVKEDLQKEFAPLFLGGGMNKRINKDGTYLSYDSVEKYEAGTPNIEAIIGLGEAIKYVNYIGKEESLEYIYKLREYALNKLKEIKHIKIYNAHIKSTTIIFNIENVFAQDAATHFASYGISLRAGQHCARLLENVIGETATLRCSFNYYNTYKEVDKFIEVAKKGSDYLEAYF